MRLYAVEAPVIDLAAYRAQRSHLVVAPPRGREQALTQPASTPVRPADAEIVSAGPRSLLRPSGLKTHRPDGRVVLQAPNVAPVLHGGDRRDNGTNLGGAA